MTPTPPQQAHTHAGTDDLPPDYAWDNRRLLLASLAPRTTTRPARRGTATTPPADTAPSGDTSTNKPGILSRAAAGSARLAHGAARGFNKVVPANRRAHTAVITVAAAVVVLAALSGVNYLNRDINPQANTITAPTTQPPAPTNAPLQRDEILTGVTAVDACPRDGNYTDANLAFDGDFNTAWVCTRAKNQDGQTIQVDFGRQVTLTQIRFTSGFDAVGPDGVDQWSQHRIVTQYEIWFPKELRRDALVVDTQGIRDWLAIPGGLNPPATVSKLLIQVKTTSEPPQPATATETEPAGPDEVTTVAISEIQFIGTEVAEATTTSLTGTRP